VIIIVLTAGLCIVCLLMGWLVYSRSRRSEFKSVKYTSVAKLSSDTMDMDLGAVRRRAPTPWIPKRNPEQGRAITIIDDEEDTLATSDCS